MHLHGATGTLEHVGQKLNQFLIGRGIHRRGSDLHLQFITHRLHNFIPSGAGHHFDVEEQSVTLDANVGWQVHGESITFMEGKCEPVPWRIRL